MYGILEVFYDIITSAGSCEKDVHGIKAGDEKEELRNLGNVLITNLGSPEYSTPFS
jgi:hypothetical protein